MAVGLVRNSGRPCVGMASNRTNGTAWYHLTHCMQCMAECHNYAVQPRPMWQERSFRTPDPLSAFREGSGNETKAKGSLRTTLSHAARAGHGKHPYVNLLWDMASLRASCAITEGVDWVQVADAHLATADLETSLLPVKIPVIDSTLGSTTATIGRQSTNNEVAGQPSPELRCWLTEIIKQNFTYCRNCLSYVKYMYEHVQTANNNYNKISVCLHDFHAPKLADECRLP